MNIAKVIRNVGIEVSGAWIEFLALLPLLLLNHKRINRGNGQPVLILPGFTGGDGSIKLLAMALRLFGFRAYTWNQGRNHGDFAKLDQGVCSRLIAIHHYHKRPVALVGWSLGGRFALRIAHRHPDKVSRVVTIGSPLGTPEEGTLGEAYRYFDRRFHALLKGVLGEVSIAIPEPPPHIAVTAIVGMSDQVVPASIAGVPEEYLRKGLPRENIYIRWLVHLSMGWSARIVVLIVDRLLQGDNWQAFNPKTSAVGRIPLFFVAPPKKRAPKRRKKHRTKRAVSFIHTARTCQTMFVIMKSTMNEIENQRDQIIEQLESLNEKMARQNSFRYNLGKGIIYGIGFFIGSAIIATIALGAMSPWLGQIDWIKESFDRGASLR